MNRFSSHPKHNEDHSSMKISKRSLIKTPQSTEVAKREKGKVLQKALYQALVRPSEGKNSKKGFKKLAGENSINTDNDVAALRPGKSLKDTSSSFHEQGCDSCDRKTLLNTSDTDNSQFDEYGMGSPTDRLQFGYAPQNAQEAIVFHQFISARDWKEHRRLNGYKVFVEKKRLSVPNCEPFASILRLQYYLENIKTLFYSNNEHQTQINAANQLLDFLSQK